MDEADVEKQRVEQLQREQRKKREEENIAYTPQWFTYVNTARKGILPSRNTSVNLLFQKVIKYALCTKILKLFRIVLKSLFLYIIITWSKKILKSISI